MAKKIVIFSFCMIALIQQLDAVMIHLNNIRQSIVQTADQYLARQGFPVSQIPARLMTEYYQKVDAVIDTLKQQASSLGRSYVDDGEISSEVYFQFGKFCDNLRSIVLLQNIEAHVTDAIQESFRIQNISVSSIPSSMRQELQSRRETVMRRLRNIMTVDDRDYVRTHEIERIVKEEMTALIHRAKQQIENQQQSNGFSLWNFLFGNNTQAQQQTPTQVTEEASKIKRFQLESKVLDIVYRQLGQHNINPDKVPARVVAHYSDSIGRILSNLRERMQNYGRDYVTIAEIELMTSQKLKTVIDKIKLVGQECSICRDDYRPGQLVGNLQCGHFFHKECVNTWFAHKRTCPECSQGNASITAEEIIP